MLGTFSRVIGGIVAVEGCGNMFCAVENKSVLQIMFQIPDF